MTEQGEYDPPVGVIANGRAGPWEVSVDGTTTGVERWFIQIEGTSTYLYFEIPSAAAIGEMLRFLDSPNTSLPAMAQEMEVGTFNNSVVRLLRDDEYSDRYFFYVAGEGHGSIRISVVGDDLKSLQAALRQASDELTSR